MLPIRTKGHSRIVRTDTCWREEDMLKPACWDFPERDIPIVRKSRHQPSIWRETDSRNLSTESPQCLNPTAMFQIPQVTAWRAIRVFVANYQTPSVRGESQAPGEIRT